MLLLLIFLVYLKFHSQATENTQSSFSSLPQKVLRFMLSVLENHFKLRNTEPMNPSHTQTTDPIMGSSLAELCLSLNLNIEETVPLWKQYYSQSVGTPLKVCKNPLDLSKKYKYDQLSVTDVFSSAGRYFEELENQTKISQEDAVKEGVTLFYNLQRYFIAYKEQRHDPIFYAAVKTFSREATKWFIHFVKREAHTLKLTNFSQPNSEQGSLQDMLNLSCEKAFELIEKANPIDLLNEVRSNYSITNDVDIHYGLAEVLWDFATVQTRKIILEKNTKQKVTITAENTVIERPYKFVAMSYAGSTPGHYNVYIHMNDQHKQGQDYFAIKSNGQPLHAKDYDRYQKASNWGSFTCKAQITDQAHLFYGRKDDSGRSYKIVGAPQKIVNKSRWMEHIFDSIGHKTLGQIMIPGSHNSGTYSLVSMFAWNWAACQQSNFTNQLHGGIRYFDCRVGYHPEKAEHFWFSHNAWNTQVKLQDLLDSVLEFLSQNSKEIVILDFSHFRDCNSKAIQEFDTRFNSLIGNIAETSYHTQSIQDIVKKNKRLVVLTTHYIKNRSGWSLNTISSWANTDSVEHLKSFLHSAVERKRHYKDMARQGLDLMQAILTPTGFFTTLPSLANAVAVAIRDHLLEEKWLKRVNVILSDYACNNVFVDIAIYANSTVRV